MTVTSDDSFAQFKAGQRQAWSSFAPLATFTTTAAASIVGFAKVGSGDAVLDVGCGTGVVAVTAAHAGAASVHGLDLSPVLIDDARRNAALIGAAIEFREGDAEALPYADAAFDVVLSQFGHMFAPRPEVAIAEMLRVLKPGGRIAFSTWPPDFVIGRVFGRVGDLLPATQGAAVPNDWGVPEIVRKRLGEAVRNLEFDCDDLFVPALSPKHYRESMERGAAPLMKLVEILGNEPAKLAAIRSELDTVIETYFSKNRIRQTFLMTRAIKR